MYRVQKWGNSLWVRIPNALAVKMGLEDGSEVDFEIEYNLLIIKNKQVLLNEMLSKITHENVHNELISGEAEGEVW